MGKPLWKESFFFVNMRPYQGQYGSGTYGYEQKSDDVH